MYVRNIEPSLGELLEDEMVRLVMARDGLEVEAVRAFICAMAHRLRGETAAADLTHCGDLGRLAKN